jgi:hypothetical protein
MSDKPLPAGAHDATQAYLREQARMARRQRRKAQRRKAEAGDDGNGRLPAAHPLEFDERGFPVPQSHDEGFTERVRRLLAISP